MENEKSSPLTSVLSPLRGEAERSSARYNFTCSGKVVACPFAQEERGRVRS
jgi:hypothetical protein